MRTIRPLSRVLLLVCLLALSAAAQNLDRDMEKEEAIWQQLSAVAPRAVDTFKSATVALDKRDYEQAARLYEEVLKKASDFDPVYRRLGTALALSGRTEEGVALLEMAVEKKSSPENLYSLAEFLAYPGHGSEAGYEAKQRALLLAKHAGRGFHKPDASYTILIAQLALDLQKEADFRNAAATLASEHPELMATHYFNAIRAAMDEDWITSDDEIRKAESLGLPAETASALRESGIHSRATVWRSAQYSVYLVAAWLGGLALLFIGGKVMSTVTIRSIQTDDPNDPARTNAVSLRKVYSVLINAAGGYYYISIPVVIFLVLAVAASVTYGFVMVGRVPIKLILLLDLGALVTVYKMIRTLFVRRNPEDPGRSLRIEEAPGLWELARGVAGAIGTRPIDDIRVTPGTDLAVYERGSFRERLRDRAHRVLILGVGVLNGFDQTPFRAVLAHEYGHLSHRDTAGGDAALRVNSDMMEFARSMALSGQAVPWNIAFQFLRVYHFIFRRITHGATRLQEVLADRVAARTYGARAFELGLTHVIRRSIELEELAYWEIAQAANSRRQMRNLYDLRLQESQAERVEEKLKLAMARPPSEDDTHPPPLERFRLARQVNSDADSAPGDPVWDLFANREQLTNEMNSLIVERVRSGSD
ncbi:MAG TPA: M48 family metalloprotease [Blastocatellia bacterium]|nr:M48 family metalloprotease [Blastocatellia bacterium]